MGSPGPLGQRKPPSLSHYPTTPWRALTTQPGDITPVAPSYTTMLGIGLRTKSREEAMLLMRAGVREAVKPVWCRMLWAYGGIRTTRFGDQVSDPSLVPSPPPGQKGTA